MIEMTVAVLPSAFIYLTTSLTPFIVRGFHRTTDYIYVRSYCLLRGHKTHGGETGHKSKADGTSLASPILRPIMHPIQDCSKWRYVIKKSIKMFDRILIGQVQPKLAQNLLVHISVSHIWNVRVHHQRQQIENQVRALAKDDEGRETEAFEPAVVDRLGSTHGVDHLLADLHRRSKDLGISTEDVPEIN